MWGFTSVVDFLTAPTNGKIPFIEIYDTREEFLLHQRAAFHYLHPEIKEAESEIIAAIAKGELPLEDGHSKPKTMIEDRSWLGYPNKSTQSVFTV
ncbi:MAG: hypothetical protein P0S95_06555 [Rhabdochlamydiaceae bacterium]|nr:hypothetical protein [Candidatus Amphrikana amoebophyrae]